MNFEFESLTSFISSLAEVDLLIQDAIVNQTDEFKYKTYNKTSLLLLIAKFEKFVEDVIGDYIDNVNSLKIISSNMPIKLKVMHTKNLIAKTDFSHEHKLLENSGLMKEISKLWNGYLNIVKLEVSSKFNYGKHGEGELIKLFKNIGIENIFDEVKVYVDNESILSDGLIEVNFKGIINSVTGIRHNIIHRDATPDLTHNDTNNYKHLFELFARGLVDKLLVKLQSMEINCKTDQYYDYMEAIAEIATAMDKLSSVDE